VSNIKSSVDRRSIDIQTEFSSSFWIWYLLIPYTSFTTGADGLECVRRYREFESKLILSKEGSSRMLDEGADSERVRKPLAIIGMSANSNDSLLREILDVGMNAFISKPFSIDQLERISASTTNTGQP
jgi:CheY-like chemotaxis protein